jgi:hypothetical protein
MSDDEELLGRINAVQVSTDDLLDLAAACDEYRQQHPDREDEGMAGMYIAAQQASRNPAKAFALWSRMSALAKLLTEQGAHGWTFPNGKGDGGIFAQEAVFAAAAVHPLVQEGNEWVFDRATFLDRVLELAEADARG